MDLGRHQSLPVLGCYIRRVFQLDFRQHKVWEQLEGRR